jgi:hypothetical protein
MISAATLHAQTPSSSSSTPVRKPASRTAIALDAGTVSAGVYRNSSLGFSCKIPPGWVLRTDDMREQVEAAQREAAEPDEQKNAAAAKKSDIKAGAKVPGEAGRVLLAAFSRPPEARAADVNSSILIAAESAAAYPGLKQAAQYFEPVAEIARAQGFLVVHEPYEFPMGSKTLVREDFQRDVGTRVMRQSTLALLAQGRVVSFTFIGGTEEEVEELIQGLTFAASGKSGR